MTFELIEPVDERLRARAFARLDSLTKPRHSLGRLETLAAQVCAVQRTLQPAVVAPAALVFAADHGVADRGVSAYPRAVTGQMVANFLGGGAAISALSRLHGLDLWVIDAGVFSDLAPHPRLIDAKIRRGTRDFGTEPAMTAAECGRALERGRTVLGELLPAQCNTVLFGEMGIGNTASAALLMHGLTGIPLEDCVGRGTGLDDTGLSHKKTVLADALARRTPGSDPREWLSEFGGYEIAMLVGALLGAAARRLLIVIDGFTVTVALALAARLDCRVREYCVFAHCSAEHAHRALLRHLDAVPLLDLDLRLGEGSGAALSIPVLVAALAVFRDMATFDGAGVSEKLA